MNTSVFSEEKVEKIIGQLQQADCVLIGAGAGLSASAGIDYGDTKIFERLFTPLMKKGFRRQYELIGYNDWMEEEKWAYWATHVNYVRFEFPPSPVYQALLNLVKNKDYFVITTNVDGMFEKAGFDVNRLCTPQGDYAQYQCNKPCTHETWPTKPVIDKILPNIDQSTLTIKDSSLVPHCANCGGPVFLNVRVDDSFIDDPYVNQWEKYRDWLQTTQNKKLFVIEFGVGFNTPSIIRWPFENIVYNHSQASLLRVNQNDSDVPKEIIHKSICVEKNAKEVIESIQKKWEEEK
ncbi:hypothetical protein KY305_14360 [Bacillus sp. YC2]|uniref:SIR2 family NAD-dependent protein deacylase n=1 Tax=Bacillus sp. YC2 TaxID=2861287 RepID=UPI001CA6E1C9|nr:Sir2 family NAD-dependent protein deacetylase [Bacillus sp. YC2]MBY8913923.1 hypothetical protein [Bacillus sp. YC2]